MNLDAMSREELIEYLAAVEELERRESQAGFERYYPETGPLRRELYAKHMEFFRAGAQFRERLAMCANRVGKTEGMGGYETAVHLTGLYPKWWDGRVFEKPIQAWAAGKTNQTTRDIVQNKLFGDVKKEGGRKTVSGTGLVPGRLISYDDIDFNQHISGLIDTIKIKHVSGGYSKLGLKSYQQGRDSFEGTERDLIWLDEEPPLDIYSECTIRTATTNGIVLITFTPMEGMTETVLQFFPDGFSNAKDF